MKQTNGILNDSPGSVQYGFLYYLQQKLLYLHVLKMFQYEEYGRNKIVLTNSHEIFFL